MLILLVFLLPAAAPAQSPEKLIERGQYDDAIVKCVDRLLKERGDKTALYASLKQAYEIANALDMNEVKTLKASGQPDIWYKVFTHYYSIHQRHERVLPVSEQLANDRVRLELVDYTGDMEAARENAGAYLYAHAFSLLKSGDSSDAWLAYADLLRITKLFKEYKDVEFRMRQALGTAGRMVLLEVQNNSNASLPPDFLSWMEEIPLSANEKAFMDYTNRARPGQKFSLLLQIDITSVNVSPGTLTEKEYTSSHKNPESLDKEYKDEKKMAEDKKHPDYNKCQIKEVHQLKKAEMKGLLKYRDGNTGKLLYVVPISAFSRFENKTATASGDMFACPPEIYDILDNEKKKFPKNADMIYQVGEEFMKLIKETAWNESYIQNPSN